MLELAFNVHVVTMVSKHTYRGTKHTCDIDYKFNKLKYIPVSAAAAIVFSSKATCIVTFNHFMSSILPL
jgi:hypothetical protein